MRTSTARALRPALPGTAWSPCVRGPRGCGGLRLVHLRHRDAPRYAPDDQPDKHLSRRQHAKSERLHLRTVAKPPGSLLPGAVRIVCRSLDLGFLVPGRLSAPRRELERVMTVRKHNVDAGLSRRTFLKYSSAGVGLLLGAEPLLTGTGRVGARRVDVQR